MTKYFKEDTAGKINIHGDFHLNNELVTSSDEVMMIDFENMMLGSATLELTYWYSQLWATELNSIKNSC